VIVKVSGEFWQQMSKEILPFSFGMRCQKHQFDSIGNSRVFCLFVCFLMKLSSLCVSRSSSHSCLYRAYDLAKVV